MCYLCSGTGRIKCAYCFGTGLHNGKGPFVCSCSQGYRKCSCKNYTNYHTIDMPKIVVKENRSSSGNEVCHCCFLIISITAIITGSLLIYYGETNSKKYYAGIISVIVGIVLFCVNCIAGITNSK